MMTIENKITLLKVCGFNPAVIGCHTFSYCLPPGTRCQSCKKGFYQRPQPKFTPHQATSIIPINHDVYQLLREVHDPREMDHIKRYIHIIKKRPIPLIRPTAKVPAVPQKKKKKKTSTKSSTRTSTRIQHRPHSRSLEATTRTS